MFPSPYLYCLTCAMFLSLVNRKRAYFVDLFVRVSNKVAIDMYEKLGYVVYRRVLEYYSGDEDAFGNPHNLLTFVTSAFGCSHVVQDVFRGCIIIVSYCSDYWLELKETVHLPQHVILSEIAVL